MEILNIIQQRRSVRKYKKDIPPEEEIIKILEAGRYAPSGLNNQPWRFLVIKDKTKKDTIAEFTKYGYIIKNAPMLIMVFIDKADSYNREKDLMAIGACIQNMLLQAQSMNLGTCWLGEILNQKDKVQKFLNLDDNLELLAVITLGYPDEKPKSSRKSLKNLMIEI